MSQGVWLGLKAEKGSLIAWVLVYLKQTKKKSNKKICKNNRIGYIIVNKQHCNK